jgi:plastocyanin
LKTSTVNACAIALAALAAAGCGGSSKTTSSAPEGTSSVSASGAAPLKLAANTEGELRYDASTLTTRSGTVTIEFTNKAALPHNVTVSNAAGSVLGSTPTFQGGTRALTLNLKPGSYKFYCTVPGHRAAGMEGTLTVR